jgi:hypothetical protein
MSLANGSRPAVFEREEAREMKEEISLEGPVLLVDGELMLLIPLSDGGAEFVECTRGIGEVQGDYLKVVIPGWLADVLRVEEGDRVVVTSTRRTFGIQAVQPRLVN